MRKPRSNRLKLYMGLTLLAMAFIFIQSALPADLSDRESGVIVDLLVSLFKLGPEQATFVIRKCAHGLEYTVLGFLLMLTAFEYVRSGQSVRGGEPVRFVGMAAWPIIIGALYAVTDEFHQHFVPGRSCELRDVIIDSVGVILGVTLAGVRRKDTHKA